jgi:hypothetical protein
MAAAAAPTIPGWFYMDFHYGVEDWVRRFVYVAESIEENAVIFRLVRIEDETPARVQEGEALNGQQRSLHGQRTGAGEFFLLEGWGLEPMELSYSPQRLPTLAAVPAV